MGKNPAAQFYWNDYLRDTRILTPAARGIWADMLGFMHYAHPRGRLTANYEEFARMLSCTQAEVEAAINEINRTKVGDVIFCNADVTVINRRMDREEKEREANRLRVAKHRGNKPCNADGNENVTSYSSSSSSKKSINTLVPGGTPRPCPHQKIIEAYNRILGVKLPEVRLNLWKGKRASWLQARWKEQESRQKIEWWTGYFEYIRDKCNFLLGENDRGWKADLEWIVKSENMVKIIEGKYEKQSSSRGSVPDNGSGQPRILDGLLSGSGDGEKPHPELSAEDGGKGPPQDPVPVVGDGGRGHGKVQEGH